MKTIDKFTPETTILFAEFYGKVYVTSVHIYKCIV